MSSRSDVLAQRLEAGAAALLRCAESVSDTEWTLAIPHDGRTLGVIVHHVATMYPLELQLARTLSNGDAITGVTWADVHAINATHAAEHAKVDRATAVAALRNAAAAAAAGVRAFRDAELDRAAPISLYANAPLTCQFFIEDHALRHSYHHLGAITQALAAVRTVAGVAA